jgi:hypothetical protein
MVMVFQTKKLKEILKYVPGIVVVGFMVWGLGKSFIGRNPDDIINVTVHPIDAVSVSDVQLWVQHELERVGGGRNGAIPLQESNAVLEPLLAQLQTCSAFKAKPLKTLSENAVANLTRLGAWKGKERDAWEFAVNNGSSYLFKFELMSVSYKGQTLRDAHFRYSLYDLSNRALLWQADSQRNAGFLSGRTPDADQHAKSVMGKLRADGLLPEECLGYPCVVGSPNKSPMC